MKRGVRCCHDQLDAGYADVYDYGFVSVADVDVSARNHQRGDCVRK